MELVQDFMAALITCKSDEDLIKIILLSSRQHFNYHAKSPNCATIKLVPDYMSVPFICKFDEDPIKNEVVIIRTFSPLYV